MVKELIQRVSELIRAEKCMERGMSAEAPAPGPNQLGPIVAIVITCQIMVCSVNQNGPRMLDCVRAPGYPGRRLPSMLLPHGTLRQ